MQLLRMPLLGETMQEGIITAWLQEEGDSFDVGDQLYEVETEKVTVPVEATAAGTVARLVAALDVELAVGAIVAVIAEPGEHPSVDDIEELLAAGAPAVAAGQAAHRAAPQPAAQPVSSKRIRAMPKARALARELGIDLTSVTGTGRDGVITPDDVDGATPADA